MAYHEKQDLNPGTNCTPEDERILYAKELKAMRRAPGPLDGDTLGAAASTFLLLAVTIAYVAAPALILLSLEVAGGGLGIERRVALGPLSDTDIMMPLMVGTAIFSVLGVLLVSRLVDLDQDGLLFNAVKLAFVGIAAVKAFVCFVLALLGVAGLAVIFFGMADGFDAEMVSLAAFLLYPAAWLAGFMLMADERS